MTVRFFAFEVQFEDGCGYRLEKFVDDVNKRYSNRYVDVAVFPLRNTVRVEAESYDVLKNVQDLL